METSGPTKQLRDLMWFAAIWAVGVAAFAIVIYLYWFHVAHRPLSPISKDVVATIQQTTDIERLRKVASILVGGHDDLVNNFDETVTRAVVLIVIICAGCAAAFALCAERAWRVIQTSRKAM